jgi:predicted amidohydrolase
VGFDGHSTHLGGAYILSPEGEMVAKSEPFVGDAWISAELDPEIFEQVRRNPWFPLKKRRPETYGELTRQI